MTRRNLFVIGLAVFAALGATTLGYAASRATLTGSWVITIESPQGEMESTWDLEQTDDGALSGVTHNDMMGEASFEDGWVTDDSFGFTMFVDMQGQAFDISYEGTFTETEMAGVLDVGGGQFTADFIGVRNDGGTR